MRNCQCCETDNCHRIGKSAQAAGRTGEEKKYCPSPDFIVCRNGMTFFAGRRSVPSRVAMAHMMRFFINRRNRF